MVAGGLAAFGARVTCADLDLNAAQRTAETIGISSPAGRGTLDAYVHESGSKDSG